MYGLINKALKSMIIERFGDDQWRKVMDAADVPDDSFITMRSYDDEVTYKLATAASDVLGAPLEACLELFGEYWISNVATDAYGPVLDVMGDSVESFLESIDALHDRISTTFINYVPPSFSVDYLESGDVKVTYMSQRVGLTPFVIGLFTGIGLRFEKDISIISQNTEQDERGETTEFVLAIL